ncbi:MAG: methyltransferase [Rikenellaceae bacterium]
MNNFFKFKQFIIEQELCAMKVGTDGVLIGAWGAVGETTMLDIGCGSGLISIMAAQRTTTLRIDAIDVEESAVRQAEINVAACPWSDRIVIHHAALQEFTPTHKYDFILSNPPYFINSLKEGKEEPRAIARHSNTLSYSDLAKNIERLLTDEGIFSVILPYLEANIFIVEAAKYALYCIKRVDIKGTPTRATKRVMLQFSRIRKEIINDELIIEDGSRHHYTQKYKELTKEFYLKF